MPELDTADVVELAKLISPSVSLTEIRPGVTKKNIEFSVEQWCRIVIAARACGESASKLIRIVMQEYLNQHTIDPGFLPPARIGVSSTAFDVGSLRPVGGIGKSILEKLNP